MSLRWVPPEMAREGTTPILLDVLIDVGRPVAERELPPPSCSLVFDRDGYARARALGLAVIEPATPGVASLGDPFVLTDAGRAMVERWRLAVRELGRSKGGEGGGDAS